MPFVKMYSSLFHYGTISDKNGFTFNKNKSKKEFFNDKDKKS